MDLVAVDSEINSLEEPRGQLSLVYHTRDEMVD